VRATYFSFLQTVQKVSGNHQAFCLVGIGILSQGQSSWVVNLTTHFHLLVRLVIIGVTFILPTSVFMILARKILPTIGSYQSNHVGIGYKHSVKGKASPL
jgi:hypothetical protein